MKMGHVLQTVGQEKTGGTIPQQMGIAVQMNITNVKELAVLLLNKKQKNAWNLHKSMATVETAMARHFTLTLLKNAEI